MMLRISQLSVAATLIAICLSGHDASAMIKRDGLFQKKKIKTPMVADAAAAAAKARSQAKLAAAPADLIAMRAQKVVADLMSRPLRPIASTEGASEVTADASKSSWLQSIYSSNMVETSWATEMLSDKRLFAEVLKREMGEKAQAFYPKTLGLREFLSAKHLVNAKGFITASGDDIEEALNQEFPSGFIVRPAVGVAPQETGRGLYPDTDQFIVDLMKASSPLFAPGHMQRAVRSHILDAIASGEGIVLQENFIMAADAKAKLKNRFFQEVRIHTYEARVVEDAVPARWVQTNVLNKGQVAKAEEFVAEFLRDLPVALTTRQAWGVDVAVMDNGQMKIIDVVTNRGKSIAWSSYLDQPRVIAAYTKHFEEFYGLHFGGLSGTLIRHGFANYLPFWEKRIENAKPGLGKMTAYLPPVP